jgi:thiamine pyrophosphate-dependent acetolactate synthase large subunit-like protein
MTKLSEFYKILAAKVTDELVVTNLTSANFQWRALTEPRDANIYDVYMSGATSVALAMAKCLPHRGVISLDGDGSILMGLSILLAVGQQNPSNLTIIIADNESYDAVGGHPTFTADKADLVAIAQGAGITNVWEVRELSEFQRVIDEAFQADGASLINLKVEKGIKLRGNMNLDGIENKYRFIRYIERTENLDILTQRGSKAPDEVKWPKQ